MQLSSINCYAFTQKMGNKAESKYEENKVKNVRLLHGERLH